MKEPAPGSGAAGRTGEGGERRGAHLREGLRMGWGEAGEVFSGAPVRWRCFAVLGV